MKQILLNFLNAWKAFGKKIATFVSLILLVLLYLVIFAPVGIVMTIVNSRKRKKYKETYWINHDPASDTLYEQQF